MALAKTTQDHDEIRKWAEARGGKPAVVASTESETQTGILRLMFPDAPNHNDSALEEISWDEFFEKFDDSGLQLTYQEETADHQISDFNKLTYPDPDSSEGKALLRKTAQKKGAKKFAAKKGASVKAAAKSAPESASKSAAKKTPAKASAKKTVATKTPAPIETPAKKTPAKKTPGKKSAAKKTANKSASKKSTPSTPARNYPKPDGNSPTQVF